MASLSEEESELRDWVSENCKNYNPARSVFSVALEALKTYKANAEYAAERSQLEAILRDFKQWGEWFVTKAPIIQKAVDRLQELKPNG